MVVSLILRNPDESSDIRTIATATSNARHGLVPAPSASMRKPRRVVPGQIYDVTFRCHHSRYRLSPTKERTNLLGHFLAKYKEKYPDLKLLAVGQMGNHTHGLVWDQGGNIVDFMRDFESQLAKALNRLDGVRGAVFERRYAAIPVVDVGAIAKRIAYIVCNPAAAGLVRSHKDWTGLIGWYGDFEPKSFTYFHQGKYNKAVRRARATGAYVPRSDFEETYTLELDPFEGIDPAVVRQAIEDREAELRKKHESVLGMQRVLQQDPFDRPKWSKRTKMPLCLFSTKDAKRAFYDVWFPFVEGYRAASKAFREGELTVRFPMFSFRPCTPSG